MALPDLTALKARLRIENDVEDTDLGLMLLSAAAQIEEFVGRPITATEREWVIEYPFKMWDSVTPWSTFFVPLYPVDGLSRERRNGPDHRDEQHHVWELAVHGDG